MPILEKTLKENFNTTVPIGFKKKLRIVRRLMQKKNSRLKGLKLSYGDTVSLLCEDYLESKEIK